MGSFAQLGRQGVDLMLCDSTNADREMPQTSEASVRRGIEAVMRRAKGMVFVCSFGSNVARMASVAHAAKAARRKVALAGRSLREAAAAAEALGIMKGVPPFLEDASKFGSTQRNGCVLMCTGTQGEENAALAKLASGIDRRLPSIQPGDVVVHSARAIPGNEEDIYAILDKLRALGATIVTADDRIEGEPVHVTGHPCREDLRAMYAAVKPRLAMPVHGTPHHLAAHAELARGLGVAAATEPVNGGVYELSEGRLRTLGRYTNGVVAIMGDGARTMVPWNVATNVPVLTDVERSRLVAHVEAQRLRGERRAARDAERDAERGQDHPGRGDKRQGPRPRGISQSGTEPKGHSARREQPRVVASAAVRPFESVRLRPQHKSAGTSAGLATPTGRTTPTPRPLVKALDRTFIDAMSFLGVMATPRHRGRRP